MSSNLIDRHAPQAPKTVQAPGGADAGGPKVSSTPPAGGAAIPKGLSPAGKRGVVPTGQINAKNLARPGVIFELDGQQVEAQPGGNHLGRCATCGHAHPASVPQTRPGLRPDGNCRAAWSRLKASRCWPPPASACRALA